MLPEIHIFSGSLVYALAWEAGRKQDGEDAKAQRLGKSGWDWNFPAGVLPSQGASVGSGRPPRVPWSPCSRYQFINAFLVESCSKLPVRNVPMGGHRDRLLNPVMNRFLTLSGNTFKSLRSL